MDEPVSLSALVALWPTIVEYASDVGCGYEAARKMRDRNSIAPEHWPNVIAACEKRGIKGVTFEWLAKQRIASAAEEQAA